MSMVFCVCPAFCLLRLLNLWVYHFHQIWKLLSHDFLQYFWLHPLCEMSTTLYYTCLVFFHRSMNHLIVFSFLSQLHFKIKAIAVSSSFLVWSSASSNLLLNTSNYFLKFQTLLFFIPRSSIWFFFIYPFVYSLGSYFSLNTFISYNSWIHLLIIISILTSPLSATSITSVIFPPVSLVWFFSWLWVTLDPLLVMSRNFFLDAGKYQCYTMVIVCFEIIP